MHAEVNFERIRGGRWIPHSESTTNHAPVTLWSRTLRSATPRALYLFLEAKGKKHGEMKNQCVFDHLFEILHASCGNVSSSPSLQGLFMVISKSVRSVQTFGKKHERCMFRFPLGFCVYGNFDTHKLIIFFLAFLGQIFMPNVNCIYFELYLSEFQNFGAD